MANIKTHLNNIKGALYGKDVRESIHDGIDAINKEVESTTGRQVDLENTFDQLVINAGNSNAEIVDARVKNDGTSYSKLGDRLDSVDSQLAQKANIDEYITITNPPSPLKKCIGDGVTDNSENLQAIVDYCLENNRTLNIPDGKFLVLKPISLNLMNDGFVIKGNSPGSAYGVDVSNFAKGSILLTRSNNLFEFTDVTWQDSNIEMTDFAHYDLTKSKVGATLYVDHNINTQIKTFYFNNIKIGGIGGLLYETTDITDTRVNAPYTYIDRCYSWHTAYVVKYNNVGNTIFKVTNSLFHSTTESAINSNSFLLLGCTDTWFEGCQPTAINCNSNLSCKIELLDTWFERCGIDSGLYAWDIGKNTRIDITGGNLPGTLMGSSLVGELCIISSNKPMTIKADRCFIETPNTIYLDKEYQNYAICNYSNLGYSDRVGEKVNKNSFIFTSYANSINPSYCYSQDNCLYSSKLDTEATENSMFVMSGHYDLESSFIGTSNAYVTINDNKILYPISHTFSYSFCQNVGIVLTYPLKKGDVVNNAFLGIREGKNPKVGVASIENNNHMAYLCTCQKNGIAQTINIPPSSGINIKEQQTLDMPINVKVIVKSKYCYYELLCYGSTRAGQQYSNIVGGSNNNLITIKQNTSMAHADMYSFNITNNHTEDVEITVINCFG